MEKTWLRDAEVFGYPSAIASVKCAEDMSAVLKFAASSGTKLCVAGGRHTHTPMVQDRLCIDMTTYMNTVTVDPEKQTAIAQGGSRLGEEAGVCS